MISAFLFKWFLAFQEVVIFFFLTNPWGEITAHHDFSMLSIASSAQGCLKHKALLLVRLQICSYVITGVQYGGTEVQQTEERLLSMLPGFFLLSYGLAYFVKRKILCPVYF